jgi:hypothetical protein
LRTLLAVGSDIGEQLVALGGAFLAAGLLARAGRRIGLPTIPLFIIAGILFGPDTPGLVLVDDPDTRSTRSLAAVSATMSPAWRGASSRSSSPRLRPRRGLTSASPPSSGSTCSSWRSAAGARVRLDSWPPRTQALVPATRRPEPAHAADLDLNHAPQPGSQSFAGP